MMGKKTIHFILIMLFSSSILANKCIDINLVNLPADEIKKIEQEACSHKKNYTNTQWATKTPAEMCKTMTSAKIRSFLTPVLSGFIALYAGFYRISDTTGFISFPLHHNKPKIYLAITEDFSLIKAKGHTISHEAFKPINEVKLSLYAFEKKEDEQHNSYWNVEKIAAPDSLRINQLSVIILSNPDNFYIKEGNFLITEKNEHLVLPEIYVVGAVHKEDVIMRFLTIANYFEKVIEKTKQSPEGVTQSIQNLASLKLLNLSRLFF